jgi:hypothetical protein
VNWLGRLLTAVRQSRCNHSCYLEDMVDTRRTEHDEFGAYTPGDVSCACRLCGKVLRGTYGLALECTWATRQYDTVPLARKP